jgi:hypothetical protein
MSRVSIPMTALVALITVTPASAAVSTPTFHLGKFARNPQVTNPYFPLAPGTVLLYEGHREGVPSSDRFEVLRKRRLIVGVRTTVVHDRFFLRGKLHENTFDYYAQDKSGNVWYFGETTEEFKDNGLLDNREGTWRAGKRPQKGAPVSKPGIFMPARPVVGAGFKQEIAPPVSTDEFETLDLNASITTPYVTTNRSLRTKEFNAQEPGVVDNKYYVLGIGTAIELTAVGPEDTLALVNVERR